MTGIFITNVYVFSPHLAPIYYGNIITKCIPQDKFILRCYFSVFTRDNNSWHDIFWWTGSITRDQSVFPEKNIFCIYLSSILYF